MLILLVSSYECQTEHKKIVLYKTNLLESDVLGVLAEAATAHVEAVLADETMVVGAHTAKMYKLTCLSIMF